MFRNVAFVVVYIALLVLAAASTFWHKTDMPAHPPNVHYRG